ncbi:hypothetical protein NPIL_523331 [Nephila pilipes]|uniref:Uncharacterized protein n=1 Tax=Nephila pilipes TaxID=299642 RepID=A0A8X6PY87_NEPPI|nr:hypothetical protein NPIL_523331 [Nephila pilipes]
MRHRRLMCWKSDVDVGIKIRGRWMVRILTSLGKWMELTAGYFRVEFSCSEEKSFEWKTLGIKHVPGPLAPPADINGSLQTPVANRQTRRDEDAWRKTFLLFSDALLQRTV